MTDEDVRRLLARPDKKVIRPSHWSIQPGGHEPSIYVFESGIAVGLEVLEGVFVRASYRAEKLIRRRAAEVLVPPKFDCALFFESNRIAAIDTKQGQIHENKVGEGHPYYGMTLRATTHEHIWTGTCGYVEPIEPPVLDVLELLQLFAKRCNLTFLDSFDHPLRGSQASLPL